MSQLQEQQKMQQPQTLPTAQSQGNLIPPQNQSFQQPAQAQQMVGFNPQAPMFALLQDYQAQKQPSYGIFQRNKKTKETKILIPKRDSCPFQDCMSNNEPQIRQRPSLLGYLSCVACLPLIGPFSICFCCICSETQAYCIDCDRYLGVVEELKEEQQ